MARTNRSQLPPGPFHIIAHAVAREPLFWDDVDYMVYLGLLQQTIERYRWRLLTFALMGNHLHLLVITTPRALSGGLWWLHWKYAEHVHRRHSPRRGHVFEGRPKTPPIKDERYLLAVLRYIANNPVKHGFCRDPDEYRWSAHRAILGLTPPMPLVEVATVLDRFGTDLDPARERYEAFVLGGDPVEHSDVRRWSERPDRDRPPLSELLLDDGEPDSIRIAHAKFGYSMRAIAAALGVSAATVYRRINDG